MSIYIKGYMCSWSVNGHGDEEQTSLWWLVPINVPWLLRLLSRSSRLRRVWVSEYALSAWHIGQVCTILSSWWYQVSAHTWQPKILRQQLANMTGGSIGLTWQIWHLKESSSNLWRPGGTVMLVVIWKNDSICCWTCLTSFATCLTSADVAGVTFFHGGWKSSSLLSLSLITIELGAFVSLWRLSDLPQIQQRSCDSPLSRTWTICSEPMMSQLICRTTCILQLHGRRPYFSRLFVLNLRLCVRAHTP